MRRPKERIFAATHAIPLVGETADPWIFLVLAALVVVSTAGVIFAGEVFPHDRDARTHVIQISAGLLVVLGAYFTAVNIREVRAQQAFDRLSQVIGQLESEAEAVRVGAVRLLESIALERLDLPSSHARAHVMSARREAIRDALMVVSTECRSGRASILAAEVLSRLDQLE